MSKASEFEKYSKKIWKLVTDQKAVLKKLDMDLPKDFGNDRINMSLLARMHGGPEIIISRPHIGSSRFGLDFNEARALRDLLIDFFKETE